MACWWLTMSTSTNVTTTRRSGCANTLTCTLSTNRDKSRRKTYTGARRSNTTSTLLMSKRALLSCHVTPRTFCRPFHQKLRKIMDSNSCPSSVSGCSKRFLQAHTKLMQIQSSFFVVSTKFKKGNFQRYFFADCLCVCVGGSSYKIFWLNMVMVTSR